MTDETIVAVYDTAAHAEAAIRDLTAAGVPQSAISTHADTTATSGATTTAAQPAREQGFWSSLFGGEPDHDTTVYDRSMQGGSTVVTVKVGQGHVDQVTQILERHHPIDIDDRANSYGLTQTTTTRTPLGAADTTARSATAVGTAATEGDRLQLSEERLAIGKRLVNRGGTRIRRFVVETPVEEEVRLRSERVTLERHPVTDARPATTADFSEKTIEMRETAEEAVVAKQAFVREEVSLRKEAVERVETVRDSVRREDVAVEQIPTATTTSTTTTTATPVSPTVPRTPKV